MRDQRLPIVIDTATTSVAGVPSLLASGHVVVLRNIDGIRQLREAIVAEVVGQQPENKISIEAFYAAGIAPELPVLIALSDAIKRIRTCRTVSRHLAPLVHEMAFGPPVRVDGGIPRLVLPPQFVRAAAESGLFPATDFKRERPDGPTEVFMPGPANIHRDYSRRHRVFQCNLWFPLHDLDPHQVVRIWPQHYRAAIVDMPLTTENLDRIGPALSFRLNFGDAVIFHGEQMHTSPVHSGECYTRHTYDFRIASFCFDDTRHYREGFLDLRNFIAMSESVNGREADQNFSTAASCALDALLRAELSPPLNENEAGDLFATFGRFEFAEDRYLIFASLTKDLAPGVALAALREIVNKSPHWFWVQEAAQEMRALDAAAAEAATTLARSLAARDNGDIDFTPIAYERPSTEPQPDELR